MHSDSLKAQRNSFAHYRAELLFSRHRVRMGDTPQWSATIHEGSEPATVRVAQRQRVRAGLLGFVPGSAAALA